MYPSPVISFQKGPLSAPVQRHGQLRTSRTLALALQGTPLIGAPLAAEVNTTQIFSRCSRGLLTLSSEKDLLKAPIEAQPGLSISAPNAALNSIGGSPGGQPRQVVGGGDIAASGPVISSLIASTRARRPIRTHGLSDRTRLTDIAVDGAHTGSTCRAYRLSVRSIVQTNRQPIDPSGHFSGSLTTTRHG